MFLLIFKAKKSSLFAQEIRDQTCRHASFVLTVISSPLTVIIFNKDFDLILKESHASFIRFLDTSFSSLCLTTRPVTARSMARPPGCSHFVLFASVNPERKDFFIELAQIQNHKKIETSIAKCIYNRLCIQNVMIISRSWGSRYTRGGRTDRRTNYRLVIKKLNQYSLMS